MRTVRHCRDRGLTLQVGCRTCRTRVEAPLSAICRAFDGWTIEELQRAGFFTCAACGDPRGVSIMGEMWGHPTDVETWTAGHGFWRRPGTDGLSA